MCSVEGCNEKHAAKGYCKIHYNKLVSRPRVKDPKAGGQIAVDFTGHSGLFTRVQKAAEAEMRPINYQLLWLIKRGLDHEETS